MNTVSVWQSCANEAPQTSQLGESSRVDVAVIGAGYAGITATLALAAGGARVAVVEALRLAEGGSGLNGGQVIPGLKRNPSELMARLGPERGAAVARFATGTAGFGNRSVNGASRVPKPAVTSMARMAIGTNLA